MYYFLTPKGRIIDGVGITPDYFVENYKDKDTVSLIKQYEGFAPMNEKVKPKAGSTGLNVYGAQQRLSLMGYDVIVSGIMDKKTVSGVKAFQKDQGLYVYGVLDYATMNALDRVVVTYINEADSGKDLQLDKAIRLLR
jgi:carboxyl-terminal processing protease